MTPLHTILLTPLSIAYGAVARTRLALFRAGALTTHCTGAPVISVGNITVGGTGKTPLVEWLARRLAGEGRRVCILTRGYARADSRKRVVVSDGERVLAGAIEGGDEPRLLAEMLHGLRVVIISDRDRVAAAQWALDNFRSELFILDDGFQHLRMARDLDIVTIDAADPWGGGRLLPAGRLREPLRQLARADCIVITRAEQASDFDALCAQIESLSGGRPVLAAWTETRAIRPLLSSTPNRSAQELIEQPAVAFCAIGNPRAFFAHLRRDGHTLKYTRAFPDHHIYTQSDVDALARRALQESARILLTTAKDAVKLRSLSFSLPCYVIQAGLQLDDETILLGLAREAVTREARKAATTRVMGKE